MASERIFVAGHNGMVGRAICRQLSQNYVDSEVIIRTRDQLDLLDSYAVRSFLRSERPDKILIAAAKVGGILANNQLPAEFIFENLMIATNIIHEAHKADIQKILFLGSSCIYPKLAPQPMAEECLLAGRLEPTNEPYAIAKIAGIKLCESYNRQYGRDYRSVMPTNLYGPYDNFDLQNSHVIPALIRKFHEAKVNSYGFVEIWGTGRAKREFLHVDDMASAALAVATQDKKTINEICAETNSHINVGFGEDIEIASLASLISDIVDFDGELKFDLSKPDGTPQKLLDISRLKSLGWSPKINLKSGLENTYDWYKVKILRES